jgi:dihydrofolate synthase/folylpolyglutamate synthase
MMPDNLPDWLSRIEKLHPVKWDLGLDRITQVATGMNLLSQESTLFLVAGTNGKGTTIAMMDAMLRAQGYTTAVATSPHLLRFNERICVNGEPVADEIICASFERIEQAREQTTLTYFEFATLASLDIFQRAAPDVVILEVGLGGRLDAMNIVMPDVSVITTVALDHQDWLGNDRESIGREKAGVIRHAKPVVLGPQMPQSVLESGINKQALVLQTNIDFGAQRHSRHWNFTGTSADAMKTSYSKLPYNHLPFDNAMVAIQAILSSGLDIEVSAIRQGLSEATVPGRFQIIAGSVPIILDVAHNPHAAAHLARRLGIDPVEGRTHGVVAMYGDKDCETVLASMDVVIDDWYFCDMAESRGESAEHLSARLPTRERSERRTCDRVSHAMRVARSNAKEGDRIVVFGSFPAVADALAEIESSPIEEGD